MKNQKTHKSLLPQKFHDMQLYYYTYHLKVSVISLDGSTVVLTIQQSDELKGACAIIIVRITHIFSIIIYVYRTCTNF